MIRRWSRHGETHFVDRVGWLRAAVLGANDGILSVASLITGVASAEGGLSLDRLKVIDSLLSQINDHRQVGTPKLNRDDVDLSKPDQTIAKLSAQAFQMQKDATPFQSWGSLKGLVLNLSA